MEKYNYEQEDRGERCSRKGAEEEGKKHVDNILKTQGLL